MDIANFQDWWDEYDLKSSDVITRSVANHLWNDAQKRCVIPHDPYIDGVVPIPITQEERDLLCGSGGTMEWQPIETAPRNGTTILLRGKQAIADGWFGGLTGAGWIWPYIYAEPLYWMPLPEAPKGECWR